MLTKLEKLIEEDGKLLRRNVRSIYNEMMIVDSGFERREVIDTIKKIYPLTEGEIENILK